MKLFIKNITFYGAIVLLYFAITSIYNYNFDPYGILENRTTFAGIRPNEHSLKVHYVLQNPEKYNSFLFSNSKGGALHFNQLNSTQENWYNMTYSLGTPEEFYKDILLFIDKNVTVKNVVIGLDEGAIYERASSHINQASRKFVPMEEKAIQWEYLFLPISIKKLLRIDLTKKHIVHDIYTNGNYYAENAYADYCDTIEEFRVIPNTINDHSATLDLSSKIKTLDKIKALCADKNISLSILIHPCSQNNFDKSREKQIQFNRLLRLLDRKKYSLFQPFKNSVIENNSCYWLDRHHYSKIVGDSIIKMFIDYKEVKDRTAVK